MYNFHGKLSEISILNFIVIMVVINIGCIFLGHSVNYFVKRD